MRRDNGKYLSSARCVRRTRERRGKEVKVFILGKCDSGHSTKERTIETLVVVD